MNTPNFMKKKWLFTTLKFILDAKRAQVASARSEREKLAEKLKERNQLLATKKEEIDAIKKRTEETGSAIAQLNADNQVKG